MEEIIGSVVKSEDRVEVLAIIAAGGSGSRMGVPGGKQLIRLLDKTVIEYSCEIFEESKLVDAYVVVSSKDQLAAMEKILSPYLSKGKCLALIEGGARRQDSVWRGLAYFAPNGKPEEQGREAGKRRRIALVHDGARCLLSPLSVDKLARYIIENHVGAALALQAIDTIRILDKEGKTKEMPERSRTIQMQTPQGADWSVLFAAYEAIQRENMVITDDVQALEHIGYPVHFLPGERNNLKLTLPEDLDVAAYLLQKNP